MHARTLIRACTCVLLLAGLGLLGCSNRESGRNQNPSFDRTFGSFGSEPGQFQDPHGIAVGADGSVYVADYGNNRIQKFSKDGAFLGMWGSQGTGDGQFFYLGRIAVDPAGTVYVTESRSTLGVGISRIQKFSSSGQFLGNLGSLGSGPGQFEDPVGIATDAAGNVYVVDHTNQRVQKLDRNGQFVGFVGESGTGSRPFRFPLEVAVDRHGNAFVTDVGAVDEYPRIVKFDSHGQFVLELSGLAGPIAVDDRGYLYVCAGEASVYKYTNDGVFVTQWGEWGVDPGYLNNPFGVATFNSRDVFVVEPYNNRVSKFSFKGWSALPTGPK